MSIRIFGRCVSDPLLRLILAEAALRTSVVCFGAISRLADFLIQVRPLGSVSPFHLRQSDRPIRAGPGRFRDISLSVSQPVVETATIGLWRAAPNFAMRRATPSIRSVLPSEVPSYFLMKSSMKALKYIEFRQEPACREEQPGCRQVTDSVTERKKWRVARSMLTAWRGRSTFP